MAECHLAEQHFAANAGRHVTCWFSADKTGKGCCTSSTATLTRTEHHRTLTKARAFSRNMLAAAATRAATTVHSIQVIQGGSSRHLIKKAIRLIEA
jgi:hypothetical protein